MRILRFIAVFLVVVPLSARAISDIHSFCVQADIFFRANAIAGSVNYSSLKKNPSSLDSLLSFLKSYEYSTADSVSKETYLINSYNLFVIETIVQNYPVTTPKAITGFYDRIKHTLGNKLVTLNEIENDSLRSVYHDPRFHFVLVCGAKGCPPIASFAFFPEQLENQLENQTRKAVNDPGFIRVNDQKKEASLSEIFKWYESDFKTNGQTVLQFINQYREKTIPTDYSISYYDYDWNLNDLQKSVVQSTQSVQPKIDNPKSGLQSYTPSVLLGKGEWEYKFFNNLYTQISGFDSEGNKINYHSRSNYFSSINQFLIGVNPRLNIGGDIWIKSVRIDTEKSSPFALLKFEKSPLTRTAISGIGPKIKIAPFRKLSHLSIQSTFLIPIAKDQEGTINGRPYLSADRYYLITQFFYDKSIGTKFQLFFQLAPWISMNKKFESKSTNVSTPVDVFFSWFPTTRTTVYVQNEFWPSYSKTGISSWFRQEGIGMKFQIIPGLLESELLYTRFSMGKNSGAGQTFNLGLRIIQ
jgi:hypothetical protein